MRYVRRAWRRLVRSPWSRWTETTARAAATACSGATNASGKATVGNVSGLLAVRPRPPPTRRLTPARLPSRSGTGRRDGVLGSDERQRQSHGRKRLRLVGGAAEAASDQEVDAGQASVRPAHDDQAQVVRVDVDAVVALDRDRGLELAGQVRLAVERLVLIRGNAAVGELAVDPDLMVGAGPGAQLADQLVEEGLHLISEPAAFGCRAAEEG